MVQFNYKKLREVFILITSIVVAIIIFAFFAWLAILLFHIAMFFVLPILKFAVPIVIILGIIFLIAFAMALWYFWVPALIAIFVFHRLKTKKRINQNN